VPVPQWRPDPESASGSAEVYSYCAVGRAGIG
jgi:hypothetical protein